MKALAAVCLGALMLQGGAACNVSPELHCEADPECVRGNDRGVCGGGHCAFVDSACGSHYRWERSASPERIDRCVPATLLKSDKPGGGAPCGTDKLANSLGQVCGPCREGKYACIDDKVECIGGRQLTIPVTSVGKVAADAEELGPAEAATDGSNDTSWLSSGIDGNEVVWRWSIANRECLTEVLISPSRQGLAGAEVVIVEILDDEGNLVMTEKRPFKKLSDTFTVELKDKRTGTPGVWGSRVQLRFVGPECAACGFAELHIFAARPAGAELDN